MSGGRLNTVYDYSSLRIHPDGSRVEQSSRNLRPRTSRTSIQDSRGNWIARDAGGLGVIRRYRRVREEIDGEVISLGEGKSLEGRKGKGKGKAKAVGYRKRDDRAAKRRKFVHDFDFLETSTSNTPTQPDAQPLPSSDLLKSIHYFASQYYNERGQLFNASKEYRQERKQRKLLKLQEKEAASTSPELASHDTSEDEVAPAKKPRRGGRVKGGKVIYRKDMYKVLDGSTLMVIGMLLQEHVNQLLEIRIPDGWEESIANVETDTEDSDSSDDHDESRVGPTSEGDLDETNEEDDKTEREDDDEEASSDDEG